MRDLLGSTPGVFVGVTLILFGFAAVMTGQALARTWRPARQLVPYALLLAAGARFISYALFDGDLLSPGGYAVGTVVLLAMTAAAYRATQARKMVTQYPWLYERAGLFAWRERA
jgi:CHASE2 domain-containing sensor protein